MAAVTDRAAEGRRVLECQESTDHASGARSGQNLCYCEAIAGYSLATGFDCRAVMALALNDRFASREYLLDGAWCTAAPLDANTVQLHAADGRILLWKLPP